MRHTRHIAFTITLTTLASLVAVAGPISEAQREHRLDHAQELLGSFYSKSAVRTGENIAKINNQIYRWTREALPKQFQRQAPQIAQAVIDESLKYGFDPVFVLSVIQTESAFNPTMTGGVGEKGLMQIRPSTAAWLTKKLGLAYKGTSSLSDPITNIKIGCAYMNYLRGKFDSHARLYIAAYNMGPRNVRNLLEQNTWPKEYTSRIMDHYISYYKQLHIPQQPTSSSRNIAAN